MARPIDDEILERFARLNVWKRGGERAPHKPLLLLLALARLQRGEERIVPFTDIERDLGRLLRDFGPPNATTPQYPFWHLQSDGLWVIPQHAELQRDVDEKPGRHNPRVSVIRQIAAQGGLEPTLHDHLRANPSLVNRIVAQLLEDNWPPSLHDEILDAVGMPWRQVTRAARDPAFRDTIIRIYSHRCAVCGWDGRLGSTDLALEAAHVKWHAAGGGDSEDNGIALCTFHHKALDRGAIGFDDERRILVSQHLHGSQGVDEWLLRFSGQHLSPPIAGEPPPALPHIHWHRHEVFREPPRSPPHATAPP